MKLLLWREVVIEAMSLSIVLLAEHCSGAASCYGFRVDNQVVEPLVTVLNPACSYTRGRSSLSMLDKLSERFLSSLKHLLGSTKPVLDDLIYDPDLCTGGQIREGERIERAQLTE